MDTAFAKVVSDPDGRDHILIEGTVISLSVTDRFENNKLVGIIVSGLRDAGAISTQAGFAATGACLAQSDPNIRAVNNRFGFTF